MYKYGYQKNSQPIRVILTGPESTGKSTLARKLASYYNGKYVPEYARGYIEQLNREYNYSDLIHIANVQSEQLLQNHNNEPVFFDTGLIITKVWFQKRFNKIPKFLNNYQTLTKGYLYLLCKPDIPWIKDSVRENGGEKRIELFNIYQKELIRSKSHFSIISGKDELRFDTALKEIKKHF